MELSRPVNTHAAFAPLDGDHRRCFNQDKLSMNGAFYRLDRRVGLDAS